MKFNMGCGHRKLPGFVNVDASPLSEPDEIVDLEAIPWPWPDGCASEVRFLHSLEHMGGEPKVFLAIMGELYRIAEDGCRVLINVPHPRHDNYLGDPTHVRPITTKTLALFDAAICQKVIDAGGANTPLALMLGVDFETLSTETVLDEPYFGRYAKGDLTADQISEMLKTSYNIARELKFTLKAHKPSRQLGEHGE
jgi:hypothetical protein